MQVQRRRDDFRSGVENVICPFGPTLSSSGSRWVAGAPPCGAVLARDQRAQGSSASWSGFGRVAESGLSGFGGTGGFLALHRRWADPHRDRRARQAGDAVHRFDRGPTTSNGRVRDETVRGGESREIAGDRPKPLEPVFHDRILIEDVGMAAPISNPNESAAPGHLRRCAHLRLGVARRPTDPSTSLAGSRKR
ncbi:hypothetical protein [Saccharopolyspora halophila]|uniref:hypothetical protein n=1 Tax=Saccharopolyspora halophila TaxID=405551 RepID=UPI0031D5E796